MNNHNQDSTRAELKKVFRFFARKRSKYIFLVLDDQRILDYLIVSIRIDLKKRKKEIINLKLSDNKDAFSVYHQVKKFLENNKCDGLIITNLNSLIYKKPRRSVDLLNKSRDAFEKFALPIVFVVNTDNLKKIINGAPDFYQLRDLPDFHFEGFERSVIPEPHFDKFSQADSSDYEDAGLKAELLEEQLRILTRKKKVNEDVLNALVVPLLNIYIDNNDFKKVTEIFNRHIKDKEELVRDKIVLGDCYHHMFDFGKAINVYRQALDYYRNLENKPLLLKCYLRLGNSHLELGSYDDARSFYEKSLKIGKEIRDNTGIAVNLHKIGLIYLFQGRYDEALVQFRQSLDLREKFGDIKGVSISLHNIGIIYQSKCDYDKALMNYQKAKEGFEKIGYDRGVSFGLHQIGVIYQNKGEYDKAFKQYEKSLEIRNKIGDISGAAFSLAQMGTWHFEQNQFEKALKLFIQAFLVFTKIGSPYANQTKEEISRLREKLPEGQFNAILKEFNLTPETFDKMEAQEQPGSAK